MVRGCGGGGLLSVLCSSRREFSPPSWSFVFILSFLCWLFSQAKAVINQTKRGEKVRNPFPPVLSASFHYKWVWLRLRTKRNTSSSILLRENVPYTFFLATVRLSLHPRVFFYIFLRKYHQELFAWRNKDDNGESTRKKKKQTNVSLLFGYMWNEEKTKKRSKTMICFELLLTLLVLSHLLVLGSSADGRFCLVWLFFFELTIFCDFFRHVFLFLKFPSFWWDQESNTHTFHYCNNSFFLAPWRWLWHLFPTNTTKGKRKEKN